MTGAAKLMFKGTEVPQHSLVSREAIGVDNADSLMCVSDYRPCCNGSENRWIRDNGNGLGPMHVSRGKGFVRLHSSPEVFTEGIFSCEIRVAADHIQTLYTGIYPSQADVAASIDPTQGNGEPYCVASL